MGVAKVTLQGAEGILVEGRHPLSVVFRDLEKPLKLRFVGDFVKLSINHGGAPFGGIVGHFEITHDVSERSVSVIILTCTDGLFQPGSWFSCSSLSNSQLASVTRSASRVWLSRHSSASSGSAVSGWKRRSVARAQPAADPRRRRLTPGSAPPSLAGDGGVETQYRQHGVSHRPVHVLEPLQVPVEL